MSKVTLLTGSQHLYGEEIFDTINAHSREIAAFLSGRLPARVEAVPVVTTRAEIREAVMAADADPECIGVITWMHTFSPAKMWIDGLKLLHKPLLQLNTQYNRDIPWDAIDMDFMNLNQSAHGDREHGFVTARMNLRRKVVAGYWRDDRAVSKIDAWVRAAAGKAESEQLTVIRFGDNMRGVAVTDGDKVEAELRLGWKVDYYGIGDLVEYVADVSDAQAGALTDEYRDRYIVSTEDFESVRVQAKYEIALERFLSERGAAAFTTNFEDLHGMRQLPGLAVQRLMEKGYGFGGEGDWRTAALTRVMKKMAEGLPGGTSFMEDYTYHLEPGNEMVLGAHMLEVCPSVAAEKPSLEVHALGIGGREPPARLVFDGVQGDAVCASMIDMGNRHRLVVQEAELLPVPRRMPRLPVARLMWRPRPDMQTAAEAWILAGGAHHTCLSAALTAEHLADFAEMTGLEAIFIDDRTEIRELRRTLEINDILWKLK